VFLFQLGCPLFTHLKAAPNQTRLVQKNILLLSLCILFFFSRLCAQDRQTPFYPTRGDSLSIEKFLTLVIEANPASVSAQLEDDAARAVLRNAQGGFDPTLDVDYEYKTKSGSPTVNFMNAGIELPFATYFGPKFIAKYKRGRGSRVNESDRTEDDGEASVGFKIPLFQGIFTDKRRAVLTKATFRQELALANERELQNELLLDASLAYWSWAESYMQLDVARRVFIIAQQRSEAVSELARRGENAAIDSIEALQEVEKRRGDVLKAQRKAESASIKLGVFLWNKDGTPQPLEAIPEMMPPAPMIIASQQDIDRQAALRRRPEVGQIEFEQRSADIDLAFSSEFQRPFVEARLEALQYKFSSFGTNDYRVGLNISQPLFFREANSNVQLAEIKVQRTNLKRFQIERKILASVDDALSAMARSQERIDATSKETKYALMMQEGERARFQAGQSSLLILNLRERAAAQAQQGLVEAQADYLSAVSDYLWATGRIQEKWIR
jgi:outer membrane protein TolC